MQWLTIGSILLYLTGFIDAGSLKCRFGAEDSSCLTEKREISPVQNMLERDTTSILAECEPGSEWDSNCHHCRCTKSGIAECVRQSSCDSGEFGVPTKCKPHTSFHSDCNFCRCTEEGIIMCTMELCPRREKRESESCEPGSTFKIDCNTCHCLENGRPACTKRGCLGELKYSMQKRDISNTYYSIYSYNSHSLIKRAVCKPNQEFEVECNSCVCASNGQSYTCTHNECLDGNAMDKDVEVFMEPEGTDHVEKHSVCKPSEEFYINCNICHCNPYGTEYSCTNKVCPLPKDVEIFHELKVSSTIKPSTEKNTKIVCVANRMFVKDCNTCWCNEEGTSYFCTRKVCVENTDTAHTEDPNEELKLREFKKECTPNEVFELDCNMCRCNPDGKSFSCTRRACIELDDKDKDTSLRKTRAAPEAPKTCQPGTEFRMDCNKCLCNDEGQDFSCTRIDCAALNNNGGVDSFASARTKRDATELVEVQCVPDSVFDRECNVCRCMADGAHASCTTKRCQKRSDVTTTTEAAPSFRCTPGDQFKSDCNDCTCSADGTNIFCTLRLCDQDLADI